MGGAVGEALGKRGAEVVRADRQAELAETVAGGIRSKGGRATAAELDVTDFRAVERLVQQTAERHGRLDYMFNNAGIGIGGGVRYLPNPGLGGDMRRIHAGVCNRGQTVYAGMCGLGVGHHVNNSLMAPV